MKQDMKEFMAKVSEDEGLRVKLEALAGLPEDEVAARMAAIACEAGGRGSRPRRNGARRERACCRVRRLRNRVPTLQVQLPAR